MSIVKGKVSSFFLFLLPDCKSSDRSYPRFFSRPMATDIFSLCLFLAGCLSLGGTLNAVLDEIDVYQTVLAIVDGNLQSVEFIHKSILCSKAKSVELDRLDKQLRKIQVALKKAGRAVNWISRDSEGNLQLGPREILAWSLIYKKIAKAHNPLLILCKEELREIKAEILELDRANKQQFPESIFFEQIQQQRRSRLYGRATRNAILYTGPPEQLSRTVADAIVSLGISSSHCVGHFLFWSTCQTRADARH